MSSRGSRRVVCQPLEPRRLLTSQKVATIGAPEYGQSPGVGNNSIYTLNYSDTKMRSTVRRTDATTGHEAQLDNPDANQPRELAFFAAGRQFVTLDEGFGWADDDAGRVVQIERGQTLQYGFVEGDGHVFFTTIDRLYGSIVSHLWVSDGTVKGTRRVGDFGELSGAAPVAFVDGRAVFDVGDYTSDQLWSIGADDDEPTLMFDPGGDGRALDPVQCGSRVLVSGKDEKSLLAVDVDGGTRKVSLGALKDAYFASGGSATEGALDDVGGAGGALLVAREKGLGFQLYLVDADKLRVRRLSSFAHGAFVDDPRYRKFTNHFVRADDRPAAYFNAAGAHGDDARWVVSLDLRLPYALDGNGLTPTPSPARSVFVVDPRRATMQPLAVPDAASAVAATREGTFALLVDNSVWRIDVDAPVPVASDAGSIAIAGDRLLMRGTNGTTFRRLRDVKPILFGSAFEDDDGDRGRDAIEPPVQREVVWLDTDGNGKRGKKEPRVTLSDEGSFYFDNLAAGTYRVGIDLADENYDGLRPTKGAKAIDAATVGGKDGAARAVRFPLQIGRGDLLFLPFDDRDGDGHRDADEPAIEAEVKRVINGDDELAETRGEFAPDGGDGTTYYFFGALQPGRETFKIRYRLSDGTTRVVTRTIDVRGGTTRAYVAAPLRRQ